MFEVTVKNMTIGQMDKQTDRTDQVYLLDTVQYKKKLEHNTGDLKGLPKPSTGARMGEAW